MNKKRKFNALVCPTTVTASQCGPLAIVQLAPSCLDLRHSGDTHDRAENSNAYVRAARRCRCVAGALDWWIAQSTLACPKTPMEVDTLLNSA